MRRFVTSRFFRLYPLYWVSIIGAVVFSAILHLNPLDWKMVLVNVTMLQQFVGVGNLIGAYWTLQIELIFYFICAALFILGRLHIARVLFFSSLLWLVVAIIMAVARNLTDLKLPVAIPLALCLMFFGSVWRRRLVEADPLSGRLAKVLLPCILAAIPLIAFMAYNRDMGFHENWHRYTAAYILAIVLFITLTTRMRIENTIIVWTGRVSYSVYLIHPLVLHGYAIWMKSYASALGMPTQLHIIVISVITLGVADLLFRLVEGPAIAWGRSIVGRRRALG